jgi:hypothetical protein
MEKLCFALLLVFFYQTPVWELQELVSTGLRERIRLWETALEYTELVNGQQSQNWFQA